MVKSLCLNAFIFIDTAKYISMKNLWNIREIVSSRPLEKATFSAGTAELTGAFTVNTDKQRLDSAHIKSNMRRGCVGSASFQKASTNSW